MFSLRSMLTVTALSSALVLSGCSGSDSDGSAESSASESSRAEAVESAQAQEQEAFEKKCSAEVQVSGVVEASWSGEGTVSNRTGATTYQSADGDSALMVYAGNDQIATNANLTIDGATYTTTDPDTGFEVAEDGSSAKIDVDTTGTEGDGPHVTATFTCGKSKG